ncbi:uncharacterized protein BO96DRAFT_428571 [Aspergillus niger CBS 101883]|uniref:Uncharacterized protein n=3 Tax=Aspergillus niger TaxID=5061 RepID=A2QX57_ASPNC|nr:uncharacterized protein BO96DRAFT_428571 [Aspergillus niger CBS 101883]XP_059604312.1 hypothetical protein An11g07710 [Aspergillus niger]PYH61802.1 hypothetical protein BO96DRAFT_428571 [Aspergillus niger CBS 101883]RDH16426.1 hypothetical protein M747DRAFT_245182 [Aspergillus niger ATCC 13496]CAK45965.1 hypothetical protein An11g07710 [Aspergillus niger]
MQDIRQPTRALTRPRYYDNDFPSNPADYLAANRDLTQRYLQLIDISWIRAHLPRITREQILPHTDPRRTQHSPPIASIAAPNSSRTPGRRVRRPQRQEDTASGQNATDRPPGAHEIRKSKLANLFKPMLEKDFPVILICWGKEERCQIVPVVITDPTDEVTAWQTISQEYYAHKGSWTKYLPWCCVNKVEIADISIAGKKLAKGTGNEYVGIYHTEDLVAKRKHLEQVIADYKPREWFCPYDISTGTVDCVGECVERCMDNEECSERIKYKAERELSLLSLRPILTQCFFRADIAAHNSLLNSEGLIHGHTCLALPGVGGDPISRLNDPQLLGMQSAACAAHYNSDTGFAEHTLCKINFQ